MEPKNAPIRLLAEEMIRHQTRTLESQLQQQRQQPGGGEGEGEEERQWRWKRLESLTIQQHYCQSDFATLLEGLKQLQKLTFTMTVQNQNQNHP